MATDFILPLFRINLEQKTNLQWVQRAFEVDSFEGQASEEGSFSWD